MNAEMIAGVLTVALVYGLILFSYSQAIGSWRGRKKLATIPHLNTRERLRQSLRARLRSRTQ